MELDLDWPKFKAITSDKQLPINYVELDGAYVLYAYDAPMGFTCKLRTSVTSIAAHITDFEQNYKASANGRGGNDPAGRQRVASEVHTYGKTVKGRTIEFVIPSGFAGGQNGTDPHVYDYRFEDSDGDPIEVELLGAVLTVDGNAEKGDILVVQVIDKAAVLVPGTSEQNPYVLEEYLPRLRLRPDKEREVKADRAQKIPAGLYIRASYYPKTVPTSADIEVEADLEYYQ